MQQHIRIATAADLALMIRMINAAFGIEAFIEGPRTDERHMTELMQKGEFLVAEDGPGRVIASVFVELRGERGYFGMLAVDPSSQRSGIGYALIQAAERHCRQCGCKHMDLTVLNLRPELLPFYRRLGYVETAREPFQDSHRVKGGVECFSIVMSKVL